MKTEEERKTIFKSLFRAAVIARALGILWAIITAIIPAYYLYGGSDYPILCIMFALPPLILLGIAWLWEFAGGVLISILGIYFGGSLIFAMSGPEFWPSSGVDFGILAYLLLQIVVGVLFCHIGWKRRLARRKLALFDD